MLVEFSREGQSPGLYGPCPNCPVCLAPFVGHGGTSSTLVGYFSPPGHDHDRNCLKRRYRCSSGHVTELAKVRTCETDGCGWRGKTSCFCCRWFVDEWPEVAS